MTHLRHSLIKRASQEIIRVIWRYEAAIPRPPRQKFALISTLYTCIGLSGFWAKKNKENAAVFNRCKKRINAWSQKSSFWGLKNCSLVTFMHSASERDCVLNFFNIFFEKQDTKTDQHFFTFFHTVFLVLLLQWNEALSFLLWYQSVKRFFVVFLNL